MSHKAHTLFLAFALSLTVVANPTVAISPVSEPAIMTNLPGAVSPDEWKQIRGEHERHRHSVVADPASAGFRAHNPGQQWLSKWDGRGLAIEPDHQRWTWNMRLAAYGFAGMEVAVQGKAGVQVDGVQVTYAWDRQMQEWFRNGANGVEHGFTLQRRPDGAGPLHFRLQAGGSLTARTVAGDAIHFFEPGSESAALTYSGLRAWDADGRSLPAAMAAGPSGELTISVDEAGARYPLTIDPDLQQAYLKAANTGTTDLFGFSMAAFGETLVVGAPGEASSATGVNGNASDDSASGAGAAYVFVREDGVWTQQAYLKASNTGAGDEFGYAVAIDGETIVVGAPNEASFASGVGADQTSNAAPGAGAAYVFVRSGTTWSQQAYVKSRRPGPDDGFGASVAIFEDTAVVGVPQEDSESTGVNADDSNNNATSSGAAYVYVRSGSSWSWQAYLKASNTNVGDEFGTSVAVSDEKIIVGAAGEDSAAQGVDGDESDNTSPNSGAGYVFERSGTAWSQTGYLKGSNSGDGYNFGRSSAVSGNTLVIGACSARSLSSGGTGPSPISIDGLVYVFVRQGGEWVEQTRLKASNAGGRDTFGRSVALYRDTLVVGAEGEDSSETGVNPNQKNSGTSNAAENSGAAYLFIRRDGVWLQHAYLKASNTEPDDRYGFSVAVVHYDAVVGAVSEDSTATGIDGDDSNNSASMSGAGYAYGLEPLREDKVYQIRSKATSELLTIDETGRVVGSVTPLSPNSERFTLEFQDDGTFFIVSRSNGLRILEGGAGARMILTMAAPTDEESGLSAADGSKSLTGARNAPDPDTIYKFILQPQPDGSYHIRNSLTDRRWQYSGTGAKLVSTNAQPENDTIRFFLEPVEFADVGEFAPYNEAVSRLYGKSVTGGCAEGPLMYCPDQYTLRGQMATFIVRALLGTDDFPYDPTPIYADVPLTNPFFKWIQKLSEMGITVGCADSPLRFCPDDPIKRSEMAVFITRARYGPGADFPYPAAPIYTDVPTFHPFFKYIQRFSADRITNGCASDPLRYCGGDFVPRWQMAMFIVRGLFNELLPLGQPRIVSITPNTFAPGFGDTVTITVENLDLTSASPSLLLGPDLTAGSISVVNEDTLTVSIDVDCEAPAGPRPLGVAVGEATAPAPRGIIVTDVP